VASAGRHEANVAAEPPTVAATASAVPGSARGASPASSASIEAAELTPDRRSVAAIGILTKAEEKEATPVSR
jgi:hypothetical protein